MVFLPYIFSHDEVRRILALAASHQGRFIGASMLRTLILVLYCTGLRLGEAVRLRMADVDLDQGTLMIRHSKGRSRIIAIRADLVAELRRHVVERRRLLDERRQPDPGDVLPAAERGAPDGHLGIAGDPTAAASTRSQASHRARRSPAV